MKRVFWRLLLVVLLLNVRGIDKTNAYYLDRSTLGGFSIGTGCWSELAAPVLISPGDNSAVNAADVLFVWEPGTSSCSRGDVAHRLVLSEQNDFSTLDQDSGWVTANSYSVMSIAEKAYWWKVLAKDQSGNQAESLVYRLTIDRTSPSVSLSVSGSWTKLVAEKLLNGDFENGLAGWTAVGDVSLLEDEVISDTTPLAYEVNPYSGSKMVRLGWQNYPFDEGGYSWQNRLMQSVTVGAKSLSLNYNFFSRDADPYDDPGFFIRLNGQEIFRQKAVDVNPAGLLDGHARYTGWQQFYYDLSGFTDSMLNLIIYGGNTADPGYQSWVYVDKITTYFVAAPAQAVYQLNGDDPSGSGIDYCEYQIDDLGWQTGSSFSIGDGGQHTLAYRCFDRAGNPSPLQQVQVITDVTAPGEVAGLGVENVYENSVELSWEATGNDDYAGRAAKYDLRYQPCADTAGFDFAVARAVDRLPSPRPAGEMEYLTVAGLNPATQYCFAFKAADEAPNWSSLSNVVMASTLSTPASFGPQDVVINELLWMGTPVSAADEYLELRNRTDRVIDLTDWQLFNFTAGADMDINFTGKSISPHGYFLIGNAPGYAGGNSALKVVPDLWDSSLELSNTSLLIGLLSPGGDLIDLVGDGGPPQEGHYLLGQRYYSMERISLPRDGTQWLEWYTCIDQASTADFFSTVADVRGTPGGVNRSENEPLAHQSWLNRASQPTPTVFLAPTASPTPTQTLPPIPTEPVVANLPEVDFRLNPDGHSLYLRVYSLSRGVQLSYEIIYESAMGAKGVAGSVEVESGEITHDRIILGSCSTEGKVCVYDQDVKEIRLKLVITSTEADKLVIEKEIADS